MTWTRAELKERAKKAFYRNYWKCVLVAFLLGILGGGGGGGSVGSPISSSYDYSDDYEDDYDYDYDYDYNYDYNYNYGYNDLDTEDGQMIQTTAVTRTPSASNMSFFGEDAAAAALASGVIVFVVIIVLVVTVFSAVISIFLFNPFQVGGCHFFLENASVENPSLSALTKAFKNNYKTTCLTMFLRGLYTFLWSLLFIIPGIIKGYEYRMVPYILADHPEMSHKEVFALSKKMMDGDKWNTFVLDLSFLGWNLLSLCTCGILSIFYVNPYMKATDAELYFALKRIKCSSYDNYNANPYAATANSTVNPYAASSNVNIYNNSQPYGSADPYNTNQNYNSVDPYNNNNYNTYGSTENTDNSNNPYQGF